MRTYLDEATNELEYFIDSALTAIEGISDKRNGIIEVKDPDNQIDKLIDHLSYLVEHFTIYDYIDDDMRYVIIRYLGEPKNTEKNDPKGVAVENLINAETYIDHILSTITMRRKDLNALLRALRHTKKKVSESRKKLEKIEVLSCDHNEVEIKVYHRNTQVKVLSTNVDGEPIINDIKDEDAVPSSVEVVSVVCKKCNAHVNLTPEQIDKIKLQAMENATKER